MPRPTPPWTWMARMPHTRSRCWPARRLAGLPTGSVSAASNTFDTQETRCASWHASNEAPMGCKPPSARYCTDGSPFLDTKRAANCLVITPETGRPIVVRGQGAGRWPTTEAVFADILDLCRGEAVVAAEA